MHPDPSCPKLVLDTHVVLDWLYFGDPRAARLGDVIRGGLGRWIASPAMETELRHVLGRDIGARGAAAGAATLRGWQRWVELIDVREPKVPPGLRCTDPDDQKFLDLGWRLGHTVLLSADKAVLRLTRRAALEGLTIMTLDDWNQRMAGGLGTSREVQNHG